MISRIDTENGWPFWTFKFTPASAEYCVTNYREFSTDHVHYTLVGDVGGVKKLGRLIIDSGSRFPIGSAGDIFTVNSGMTDPWIPIAVQGLSKGRVQALFYDPSSMIVYHITYDLD